MRYLRSKINRANSVAERAYALSHYVRESIRLSYNMARILTNLGIMSEAECEEILTKANHLLDSIHIK